MDEAATERIEHVAPQDFVEALGVPQPDLPVRSFRWRHSMEGPDIVGWLTLAGLQTRLLRLWRESANGPGSDVSRAHRLGKAKRRAEEVRAAPAGRKPPAAAAREA